METKNSIRKEILSMRNAISKEDQARKSVLICDKVLTCSSVQNADTILCYAGYKSEVLTDTLIRALLEQNKNVYLPRVTNNEMDFFKIHSLEDLEAGYMSIPEPGACCTDLFSENQWKQNETNTVMIVPGCAFSEKGARIGYGKGYYDRYLMRIPCNERIALCYEFQLIAKIPSDTHDIPMTQIITEQRMIKL